MLHLVLGFSLFSPNALLGDMVEGDAVAVSDSKEKKEKSKRVHKSKKSTKKKSSVKKQKASKAKSKTAKSKRSVKRVRTVKKGNETKTVRKSKTVKTRSNSKSKTAPKSKRVSEKTQTRRTRTVESRTGQKAKSGKGVTSRQEAIKKQRETNRKSRMNNRRVNNRRVDTETRVGNRRVNNRRSSQASTQTESQRGVRPNVRRQANMKNQWKHKNKMPPKSRVTKPSYTPKGWNPDAHRQSMNPNDPRYYAAGVFYYNQPPRENVTIIEHNYYGQQVSSYQAPKRQVDHRKSLSFGLRGGAQTSNINDGSEGTGLGFAVGYRVFEPIGVEFAYMNYGEEIDMDMDSPGQASAQLFLFPWTRVSPYVTGGVTFAKNGSAANETEMQSVPDGYAYGPHGGVGVQFGLGRFGLNVEGRYTKFSNVEEKSRLQGILGLDYHF
jgi:hypothetical protein